jgi:hypothetical protein
MNANHFVEAVCDESSDASVDSFFSDSWSSFSDDISLDGDMEEYAPSGVDISLRVARMHSAHDNKSETTSSEEEESDEESNSSIIGLYVLFSNLYRLHNQERPTAIPRFSRVQYTRIDWDGYWEQYRNDPEFENRLSINTSDASRCFEPTKLILFKRMKLLNLICYASIL